MSDIHSENAELLDATINRILKKGMVVQKGITENGEPIMACIDPPAAFLTAAIKRLQQLGMGKGDTETLRDPNEHVLARLRSGRATLTTRDDVPPLSDGKDAATG